MATSRVVQAQIGSGAIRDKPIQKKLETLLDAAARKAGVDSVVVTSGGQPGTAGKRTGSTRHDGGRAADLHLVVNNQTLRFSDASAPFIVIDFITECARLGANGIGAGVAYMGDSNIHVGFGRKTADQTKVVWGAGGKSVNTPRWLTRAATAGWSGASAEMSAPIPRPSEPVPAPPDVEPAPEQGKASTGLVAFFAWLFGMFGKK